MAALKIGDLVRVVRCSPFPNLVGKTATIVGIDRCPGVHLDFDKRGLTRVAGIDTMPRLLPEHREGYGCMHWVAEDLEKIDPPDWEADRIEDKELTV